MGGNRVWHGIFEVGKLGVSAVSLQQAAWHEARQKPMGAESGQLVKGLSLHFYFRYHHANCKGVSSAQQDAADS